jgi:hypothetical protein
VCNKYPQSLHSTKIGHRKRLPKRTLHDCLVTPMVQGMVLPSMIRTEQYRHPVQFGVYHILNKARQNTRLGALRSSTPRSRGAIPVNLEVPQQRLFRKMHPILGVLLATQPTIHSHETRQPITQRPRIVALNCRSWPGLMEDWVFPYNILCRIHLRNIRLRAPLIPRHLLLCRHLSNNTSLRAIFHILLLHTTTSHDQQ